MRNDFPRLKIMFVVLSLLFLSGVSDTVENIVREGNDWYSKEAYKEAALNYRAALKKDPYFFAGHYNLGNALYKLGQYTQALQSYQKAVEIGGESQYASLIYYNLGNT